MPADGHISEDILDEYVMGRPLPPSETKLVVEHIRVCDQCKVRLAKSYEFAVMFREMAERETPEARPAARKRKECRRRGGS